MSCCDFIHRHWSGCPTDSASCHLNEYAELSGIDGEPSEFEWNIFPRFIISIEIFRHIQKDLKARQMNPKQFEGTFTFMSMFNDTGWTENSDVCISNAREVSAWAKVSARASVILWSCR